MPGISSVSCGCTTQQSPSTSLALGLSPCHLSSCHALDVLRARNSAQTVSEHVWGRIFTCCIFTCWIDLVAWQVCAVCASKSVCFV